MTEVAVIVLAVAAAVGAAAALVLASSLDKAWSRYGESRAEWADAKASAGVADEALAATKVALEDLRTQYALLGDELALVQHDLQEARRASIRSASDDDLLRRAAGSLPEPDGHGGPPGAGGGPHSAPAA